jgi:natural product precursor
MKKLKKLNLKDASLMTDSEMKMVVGGYTEGTCSATCPSGSISVSGCKKCYAEDGKGVTCDGKVHLC